MRYDYLILTVTLEYTRFRLQGIRIYGISGYMDHFWLVRNGIDFHTIRFFGYMEFFEAIEAGFSRLWIVKLMG